MWVAEPREPECDPEPEPEPRLELRPAKPGIYIELLGSKVV